LVWATVAAGVLATVPAPVRPALWWPALAGLVVLLARSAFPSTSPARKRDGSGQWKPLAAALLLPLLAALALLAPADVAGQAKVYTVYILGPAAGPPEQQKVLAPAALLEQLQKLCQPPAPKVPDAILVSAEYQGQVKD